MSELLASIGAQLAQLQSDQLLRQRRVVSGAQGPLLEVDGAQCLAFCSNDYLGLANHPALAAAAHAGLEQYGVGAGASPMISGHSAAVEALEAALARFVGAPRALHFNSGYMANTGIIPALVGEGDVVLSDRLNHACLLDGARLSGASLRVYPHLDTARLARELDKHAGRRKLVVTDGVFSMDGDIAPLAQILALCERHDALLLVDDAHAFGVLGPQGRGSAAHFGLASPRLLTMGTLGKAAGVHGAFVAGDATLIEWLLQRARTYIFSTASPPALACATLAALELIEAGNERRAHLQQLIARLRAGLVGLPWPLLDSQTPVQALVVQDNQLALDLMEGLRARGIWVPAIRPPTVPRHTARLRMSLTALHTVEQVDHLVEALQTLARPNMTHARPAWQTPSMTCP